MVQKAKKRHFSKPSILAIGYDVSPSCIAGAAISYDGLLDRLSPVAWQYIRWSKTVSHNDKLREAAKAGQHILDLIRDSGNIVKKIDEVYIGIEEIPPPLMRNSQRVREQAEVIGAFAGALLRYGYPNVLKVPVSSWHSLVASDFDMSFKEVDKWIVKDWAIEVYNAPKWKDLIRTNKMGLIPKPKESKAKPEQPDDRYDATGVMQWVWDFANLSAEEQAIRLAPKPKKRRKKKINAGID